MNPHVRDQTEFVSPFPFENCKSRLEQRNEEKSFWAMRYQTRIRVDVWEIDHDRAGFRVKQSPKSSLEWDIGVGGVQLKGVLQRRSDGKTDVLAYVKIGFFSYFFTGVFLVALWGLFFMWGSAAFNQLNPALIVIGTGALIIPITFFMLWWFDAQKVKLISVVETTLKGF